MADGDLVADDKRTHFAGHMQDTAVLNIRALADADIVDIAAHHGVEPHTAFFADGHIADHLGAFDDERRSVDDRLAFLVGMNHWSKFLRLNR